MTVAPEILSRRGELNPRPTHYECVQMLWYSMSYDRSEGFARDCAIPRGNSQVETAQYLLTEGLSLLAELFPNADRLLRRLFSRNSEFNAADKVPIPVHFQPGAVCGFHHGKLSIVETSIGLNSIFHSQSNFRARANK